MGHGYEVGYTEIKSSDWGPKPGLWALASWHCLTRWQPSGCLRGGPQGRWWWYLLLQGLYTFWLQPIVWKTSYIVTWYTDLCTWTCVFIGIKWKQEFTPPKLLYNKHGTLIFPILFSFTFFRKADNSQNCYHDPIRAFDPKHCFGLIWMSAYGDCCLASVIPGPSPPIHPPEWQ